MPDRRRPRVAVLGAGSWGTTLASIVSRTTPCVLWARSAVVADEINTKRTNAYLPGFVLPGRVRATTSLGEAASEADVLVSAIPTQSVRGVLADAAPMLRPWIPVVSVSKALEQHTHLRVTEL